jgi:hypothetical protein
MGVRPIFDVTHGSDAEEEVAGEVARATSGRCAYAEVHHERGAHGCSTATPLDDLRAFPRYSCRGKEPHPPGMMEQALAARLQRACMPCPLSVSSLCYLFVAALLTKSHKLRSLEP